MISRYMRYSVRSSLLVVYGHLLILVTGLLSYMQIKNENKNEIKQNVKM